MTWEGSHEPSAEPSTEPSSITCSIEGGGGPVPLSEKKTPMPCSGSSSVVPVNWKGCWGLIESCTLATRGSQLPPSRRQRCDPRSPYPLPPNYRPLTRWALETLSSVPDISHHHPSQPRGPTPETSLPTPDPHAPYPSPLTPTAARQECMIHSKHQKGTSLIRNTTLLRPYSRS